jgi:nitroimidazol reductase NimA-like FMN-containing flavoprotein (pyridoxamine 5'-phosphate oxidase superfamily)
MSMPKRSGPWSHPKIAEFLNSKIIPARVSVVSDSGWPIVTSLWFLYERETIFCAVRSTSRIAGYLAKQPRVGFEIAGEAPPYMGVRGQGLASLSPDDDGVLLTRLIDRYLGKEETEFRKWLLSGADDELAVAIKPVRLMSWDYRGRMRS